MQLTWCICRAT